MITQIASSDCDAYSWRRPRSESSADAESMYMTNPVLSDSGYAQQSRRSSVSRPFKSYQLSTVSLRLAYMSQAYLMF